MAKLHIFGDSYSVGWDRAHYEPRKEAYVEWLGRTPKHFGDIIKKEFNIDTIHNYSVGGYDNYSILESIGRNISTIKKNDYVCIGWSDISRYRIVWDNLTDIGTDPKRWLRFTATMTVPNEYENIVPKEYHKQVVERDCNLTINEIESWQNILKTSLPKNTIYWSPFVRKEKNNPWLSPPFYHKLIKDECDIEDWHFGEGGMIQVGEWLVDRIKSGGKKVL